MASPAFRKKNEEWAGKSPITAMVIFQPIGNPLEGMADQERSFFFDTLFRILRVQTVENVDMARQIAGRSIQSISLARQPAHFVSGGNAQEKSSLSWKKPDAISPAAKKAQQAIAASIAEYAQGDLALAREVLSEFESRIRTQGYKSDDLMAVLLLVIEDRVEAGAPLGKGGASSKPAAATVGAERLPAGAASPKIITGRLVHAEEIGASTPPTISAERLVPQELKDSIRASVEVRLASVREMLRYYFARNPQEYQKALSKLLAIPAAKENDSEYVQERLASELSAIGSFGLAQRLLTQIKKQEEMDTTKCLLELGYKFEGQKKRLILGKRTCGSKQQAASIVQLLLSNFRGKRLAERDVKPRPRVLSVRPRKPAAPN
jgi:hypothetical protein